MHNLLEIAKKIKKDEDHKLSSEEGELLWKKRNADALFDQVHFEFTKENPQIIFVKDFKNFSPTNRFLDLEEIFISAKDKKCIEDHWGKKIIENPKFYNGNIMFLTGLIYDEGNNIVYVKALRKDYAFLIALRNHKFPKGSDVYKLSLYEGGVMVPFVTKNGDTHFLERSDGMGYSSVGGTLEVKFNEANKNNPRINFSNENLIVRMACEEAEEELLGKTKNPLRPQTLAVTIRERKDGGIGMMDFTTRIVLKNTSCQMVKKIKNNSAQDAYEHTRKFQQVPLESYDRAGAIQFLNKNFPGSVIYKPLLATLTNDRGNDWIVNPVFPSALGDDNTMILSTKQLRSILRKPLPLMPTNNELKTENQKVFEQNKKKLTKNKRQHKAS